MKWSFLISVVLHAGVLALPLSPTLLMRERLIPVRLIGGGESPEEKHAGGRAGSRMKHQPDTAPQSSAKGKRANHRTTPGEFRAEPLESTVAADATAHNHHVEAAFIEAPASKISPPAVVDPTVGSIAGEPGSGAGGVSGAGSGRGSGSGFGNGTGRGNGNGTGRGKGSLEPAAVSHVHPAYTVKPEYPDQARREGSEGTVLLRVLVNRRGHPQKIEINRSSGFEALDQAAQRAVEKWRFHPASAGDTNLESWVRIPIVFRLEDLNR
jgi:TonB family protein